MSVSIMWSVYNPAKGNQVPGTSNDMAILREIWPTGIVRHTDVEKLRAMHMAAIGDPFSESETLWAALADVLERLDGSDIRVWGEY